MADVSVVLFLFSILRKSIVFLSKRLSFVGLSKQKVRIQMQQNRVEKSFSYFTERAKLNFIYGYSSGEGKATYRLIELYIMQDTTEIILENSLLIGFIKRDF